MVCPPDSPLATHQPDSTGTTVPNTPASTDIDVPQGEFERLTPSNRFARLAFSQVVEMILHDPDHYTHTQDFIRFAKAGEEDGFSELSDLGEGMRAPSPPFRLWNGYYRLNLKILPVYPHLGWILGSKPMGGNGQGADLLLTSKQGDHGIGGRHTRLMFHRNTGCLMLWAGPRSVSLHGSFGTVKLKFATRALTESASISMGDLQYRFDYQTLDEKMYKEDLDHFMKKELGETDFELSGSISSLGSDTDIQLKGYTIKGVFAAGTSAMVAGAIVKQTGEFVAVKKMRKASREDPTIACELDTLAALDRVHKHPRICHIREVLRNGQGIEETYIIYEPFLRVDLHNVLTRPDVPDEARITICRQCLDGLRWVHENGVMHRDLKPENMGLKSMNPPDAVIFDFGHATFGKTSMDHFKGTIAYLAPEVLDLKYRHSQIAYDCAVDVWAMGLSLYQLTCRRRWTGQEVVKDAQGRVHDYRLTHLYAIIQELQRSKQTLISDVIPKMLQVNPRERITANSALMTIHADENKEKAFTESKRPRTE